MADRPSSLKIVLVLAAGFLAASTAAIFVRLGYAAGEGFSDIGLGLMMATLRLCFVSIILIPIWYRSRADQTPQPGANWFAIGAGVFLAIHFASWVPAFAFTSIAASTTIASTAPVWVAILLWLWRGEIPTRLTVLGIAVAISGAVLLTVSDAGGAGAGSNPMLGNALALSAAIAFSFYFLMGQEAQRRGLSTSRYVATAYLVGAMSLITVPFIVGPHYGEIPGMVFFFGLLLALVPQLIGHTSFNWSVKWVSPTLVALVVLMEPVGATFLGVIFFQEIPGWTVVLGAAILLAGVALAVSGQDRGQSPEPDQPVLESEVMEQARDSGSRTHDR
jgi:drug/metabolite transporter (DMT)-like permease